MSSCMLQYLGANASFSNEDNESLTLFAPWQCSKVFFFFWGNQDHRLDQNSRKQFVCIEIAFLLYRQVSPWTVIHQLFGIPYARGSSDSRCLELNLQHVSRLCKKYISCWTEQETRQQCLVTQSYAARCSSLHLVNIDRCTHPLISE